VAVIAPMRHKQPASPKLSRLFSFSEDFRICFQRFDPTDSDILLFFGLLVAPSITRTALNSRDESSFTNKSAASFVLWSASGCRKTCTPTMPPNNAIPVEGGGKYVQCANCKASCMQFANLSDSGESQYGTTLYLWPENRSSLCPIACCCSFVNVRSARACCRSRSAFSAIAVFSCCFARSISTFFAVFWASSIRALASAWTASCTLLSASQTSQVKYASTIAVKIKTTIYNLKIAIFLAVAVAMPAAATEASTAGIPVSEFVAIAITIFAIVAAALGAAAIRSNNKRMDSIRRKYCNTKTIDKH
jgi:hypothetical protein